MKKGGFEQGVTLQTVQTHTQQTKVTYSWQSTLLPFSASVVLHRHNPVQANQSVIDKYVSTESHETFKQMTKFSLCLYYTTIET